MWSILTSIWFCLPKFRNSVECCQTSLSWDPGFLGILVEPCKHHKEPIVPPQPSGSLARALESDEWSNRQRHNLNRRSNTLFDPRRMQQNQQNGPICAVVLNYRTRRQLSRNRNVWILHQHRWQILPRWRCDKSHNNKYEIMCMYIVMFVIFMCHIHHTYSIDLCWIYIHMIYMHIIMVWQEFQQFYHGTVKASHSTMPYVSSVTKSIDCRGQPFDLPIFNVIQVLYCPFANICIYWKWSNSTVG